MKKYEYQIVAASFFAGVLMFKLQRRRMHFLWRGRWHDVPCVTKWGIDYVEYEEEIRLRTQTP